MKRWMAFYIIEEILIRFPILSVNIIKNRTLYEQMREKFIYHRILSDKRENYPNDTDIVFTNLDEGLEMSDIGIDELDVKILRMLQGDVSKIVSRNCKLHWRLDRYHQESVSYHDKKRIDPGDDHCH